MTAVRVRDYAPPAYTYEEGVAVGQVLRPYIQRGEQTQLSFEGVSAASSSFINGLVQELTNKLEPDRVFGLLSITHASPRIKELMRIRVSLSQHR